MTWAQVEEALPEAKVIAFDGCHKIYLAMDEQEADAFIDCDYEYVVRVNDTDAALDTLREWFDGSCGLRFINAVRSVGPDEDPNKGYTSLIEQGEEGV